MKLKKETRDMDLDIHYKPLTRDEEKIISDFIKKSKLKTEDSRKNSKRYPRIHKQKV